MSEAFIEKSQSCSGHEKIGHDHQLLVALQLPALSDSAPALFRAGLPGRSGHGFLIASDNLTRQPFGPGTHPEMSQ